MKSQLPTNQNSILRSPWDNSTSARRFTDQEMGNYHSSRQIPPQKEFDMKTIFKSQVPLQQQHPNQMSSRAIPPVSPSMPSLDDFKPKPVSKNPLQVFMSSKSTSNLATANQKDNHHPSMSPDIFARQTVVSNQRSTIQSGQMLLENQRSTIQSTQQAMGNQRSTVQSGFPFPENQRSTIQSGFQMPENRSTVQSSNPMLGNQRSTIQSQQQGLGNQSKHMNSCSSLNVDTSNFDSTVRNRSKTPAKSPLETFVLNSNRKISVSNSSRRSNNSMVDAEIQDVDIEKLKEMVLKKTEEIEKLTLRYKIMSEGQPAEVPDQKKSEAKMKIDLQELELQDINKANLDLKAQLNVLKTQVDKQPKLFEEDLKNKKAKFLEAARRNMEVYERELEYKFQNNRDDLVNYLKQRVFALQNK